MIHSMMNEFELIRTRILPLPKKAEQLTDKPALKLGKGSCFKLTAPTAEYGPIKTAGEYMTGLLTGLFGADCICGCAEALPVTMSIAEKAPEGMVNAEDGYTLTITGEGIEVAGYGAPGLLYGVITLKQLFKADSDGVELPAMTVVDWPENPIRGFKEECRYGSNVMEREDWFAMMDDMVSKKMNYLEIALYGCWSVQYDGRVSEYLYLPVKNHPELKTPMVVKYYSPEQGRWIECEKLPPIFCNNLLDEVFRYARDLGLKVCPAINSLGHNTLIPAMIPEVSAKNEDGTPTKTGYCTSNPATYDLLFSIYDQIIDDYMIPYGMDMFNTVLDEVWAGVGMNAEEPKKLRSAWCSCPACKAKDKGDIFIDHAVKLVSHLKEKGMKSVLIACDMLLATRKNSLGWLGDRLMDAMEKAGVKDTLLIAWWTYFDIKEKMYFDNLHPELGLRAVNTPWTGYYNWCILSNPLRDIQILAEMNHRDGGEGVRAYSMWDDCFDRNHDAVAEYAWDFVQSGTVQDVTDRYVLRHFGARAEEAKRAFKLVDLATEDRMATEDDPLRVVVSNFGLLMYKTSYYTYSYVAADKPYPRNFPGEALEYLLATRADQERALYSISSMASQAAEIFRSLATDTRCDRRMADIFAYECENYVCQVEDWLALLRMYDLALAGECKAIAPIARERQQARLDLMAHMEGCRRKFAREALAMRNQSIFMQMFNDIAEYVEKNDDPKLDMLNLNNIFSERFWSLR